MRGDSVLEEFTIPIFGLKNGSYDYSFKVDEAFWSHFDNPDLAEGDFTVELKMRKDERVITLDFSIQGAMQLTCDRSLKVFSEPLHLQEQMIYKFGSQQEELSESLWQIPFSQESINVAQHIYEFIGLALPIKKVHPDLRHPEDETEDLLGDEVFWVYSSEEDDSETENPKAEQEPADPRWEALKKLKEGGNLN